MKKTNSTREEVLQMLEDDKRIDRGEKLFELDEDLKAGAKKARQAERKTGTPAKREKKVDEDKMDIMRGLVEGLNLIELDYTDLVITNNEREFTFNFNGKKYKVTLACPRS